jgi:hypothetical protein
MLACDKVTHGIDAMRPPFLGDDDHGLEEEESGLQKGMPPLFDGPEQFQHFKDEGVSVGTRQGR